MNFSSVNFSTFSIPLNVFAVYYSIGMIHVDWNPQAFLFQTPHLISINGNDGF